MRTKVVGGESHDRRGPFLWPKPHYVGTEGDTSDWPWHERFRLWLVYEWWLTRRWAPSVSLWWHYNVRHYPKPPPLDLDPVYRKLFGDGGDERG